MMLHPKIADALALMERTRDELEGAGAHDSEPECALHMMIHRALAGWSSFPDMHWAVFTQEAYDRLDEIGEHLFQVIQAEASFCDYGPLLAFAKRGSPNLAYAKVREEGDTGLVESNVSLGGIIDDRRPLTEAIDELGFKNTDVTGLVLDNSGCPDTDREWSRTAQNLRTLQLFFCEGVLDAGALPQAPSVQELSIWDGGFGLRENPGPLRSLRGIGAYPRLKKLVLQRPRQITDIKALRDCPDLEEVWLVDDAESLESCTGFAGEAFEVILCVWDFS